MAMPKLPPSWRDRLNSPVPWASWYGFKSATDALVSGTKMQPSPTPRRIIGQKVSLRPVWVVKCECMYIEAKKSPVPMVIITRASSLDAFRPTTAIVTALARAPGRMTLPVSHAVKPSTVCRKTGSAKTLE